ncbi:hypothetical protein [Adlercreutzia faecimuris]|uniref:YhgE/Pip domain-containing protein n=1 Tax=Adlercreutzia faecimuris TaxID=2897341 RepID=A0ABS9WFF4_9ACTN|nr:hypothetical protein [Adlercreutzia sp. JBNU-10]MCI2241598.1 hypothetical protein [Adlercreutzia sp. JBNU-10]
MNASVLPRAALAAFLAVMLALTCLSPALAVDAERPAAPAAAAAEPAAFEKTEVVYANLSAEGAPEAVFVVNRFDVASAGVVTDWGAYAERASLTDGRQLKPAADGEGASDGVEVVCDEGVFSYQGTDPAGVALPWDIAVSYRLNGQRMTPDQIAGKSGDAEVRLTVTRDPDADPAFAASFMVQATFTLPGAVWSDVRAEGGVVALAGSDQTVAFTVLPGHDGDFTLTGHVEGFELAGAQIAALPYASVIEMPDASDLEGQMGQLADAVAALDDGTASLAAGAEGLAAGSAGLRDGVRSLSDGLGALDASSGSLTVASSQVAGALDALAAGLAGADLSGVEDLGALTGALGQAADGLDALAAQSAAVRDGYGRALGALDGAMAAIPAPTLGEAQIGSLMAAAQASGNPADAATAAELARAYEAAQTARGTYQAVAPALDGARQLLAVLGADAVTAGSPAFLAASLRAMAGGLEQADPAAAVAQLRELAPGVAELAGQYRALDEGLASYVGGVGRLAAGAAALSGGARELAGGLGQFASGASDLAAGAGQLAGETADLPARMRASMDELMADYDFPEFEPASFVDGRNQSVAAVQFVMALAPVEPAPAPEPEPAEASEPTVLDRLLALFGL